MTSHVTSIHTFPALLPTAIKKPPSPSNSNAVTSYKYRNVNNKDVNYATKFTKKSTTSGMTLRKGEKIHVY